MQVLKGLVESQQVAYDCGFYELPMPADLPVTLLSSSASLLREAADVTVPLQLLQDAGEHLTGRPAPLCWCTSHIAAVRHAEASSLACSGKPDADLRSAGLLS